MATPTADEFMSALQHARADEVRDLRALIRGIDPHLTESIKWNAPSFGYDGQHRVTMNLQPGDKVQVILHRGAAKRDDAFAFESDSDLIRWAAPDRGVIAIADAAHLAAARAELADIIGAWLTATRH